MKLKIKSKIMRRAYSRKDARKQEPADSRKDVKFVAGAPTVKDLDALWQMCIKARAKYKSELSGSSIAITGHHVFHKPNFRLRWELDFGICLTRGEHFAYHNLEKSGWPTQRVTADKMRDKFLAVRGKDVYEAFVLKRQTGGTDKWAVKLYLEKKLEEFSK